jgi:hypothetical protein
VALSVQSEVCICNKVSGSADRLSTHTNFKKNCHLLVTGIPVAQTQNSVDPDNVDTSNDEGVRQDRYFIKDNRNKNTKKNCHLLLEMYAILILSIMAL